MIGALLTLRSQPGRADSKSERDFREGLSLHLYDLMIADMRGLGFLVVLVENGGPSSNGLIAEAGLPGQLGRGTTSRRQDDDQDRKQPAPG